MHLLVCCLLISLAFAAPVKPALSEDFYGEVQYHIVRRHEPPRQWHGHWYHDNTATREAWDADIPEVGNIQLWKLWNTTKGGLEYEYNVNTSVCHRRDFVQPYHGAFNFVQGSHYAGPCDGGQGARWTATIPDAFELDLCASQDGKTPFWLERIHRVEDRLHITARFHSFTQGRPSARYFVLPAACTKLDLVDE